MDDLFKNSQIAKSTDYLIKFHTLYKRLQTQENVLNGNTTANLKSLKYDEMVYFLSDLECSRNGDLQQLNEKCASLKHSMKILKENVMSSEKMQELDVDFYRKKLLDLENQLSEIKLFIKKEKDCLQKQEKALSEEIRITEKRLHEADSLLPMNTYASLKPSPVKLITSTTAENMDVQRFQKFLQKSGGHTGGWGEVEHAAFIKSWLKYSNGKSDPSSTPHILRLVEAMQKLLPDISKAEVIAHYNWLLEYRHLKEMQNKSLEVWKALREAHKYHKTPLKDSRRGDGAKITEHKKISSDSPYSKVMLEIWKNNKEEEKKNVEVKYVEQTLIQREIQAAKESHRQLDKKDIIKWTEAKKLEMEKKLLKTEEDNQREKERRSSEANKKIKEYRQRDELFVNNRKLHITTLRKSKSCDFVQNRNNVIKKSCCSNSRSYDKPTEQWCRRVKKYQSADTIISPHKPITVDYVDFLPKLGIPKWRKDILT